MTRPSASLASLDEKLTCERIRLERVLFRCILARLARAQLGGGIAERMMARFEAEVGCVADTRGPDPESAWTLEHMQKMADQAPEPYRTMLSSQRERFERINEELRNPAVTGESADPLDHLAAEIGYRAVRGALAGSVAPELASFVRKHRLDPGAA